MKIFLSTHGKMASGMKSSVEVLAGNCECLTTFDAYIDHDTVEQHVEKFLADNPDGLRILCSDIFGGSVNQVLARYSGQENIFVVTGINLALLISLVLSSSRDDMSEEELQQMIDESTALTKIVKLDFEVEENDFF